MTRKHTLLILLFAISFCVSCEYIYDMDSRYNSYKPQVIINSIINPDSVIKANLYWTRYIRDTSDYKIVESFTAELRENNTLIYSGDCVDGIINTNLYPKEGATYQLDINVPNYGYVSAKTTIPNASSVDVEYVEKRGHSDYGHYSGYLFYRVNNIIPESIVRSIMIGSYGVYEDGTILTTNYLNTSNPFVDDYNWSSGYGDDPNRGSKSSYQENIRVPLRNINDACPLTFSIYAFPNDPSSNVGEAIKNRCTDIVIHIISPSDDYDKYYNSAYMQRVFISFEPQIFNKAITVHSNIKGGIGIFAGYSSTKINFKPDYD